MKIKGNIVLIGIIVLTLVTAGAHLYLSSLPDEELGFWFMLNGFGYLALLAAFFLPQLSSFRRAIRWIFLFYTLLTIFLWFVLGGPREGEFDPFDISVKLTEAALVGLLFLDSKKKGR